MTKQHPITPPPELVDKWVAMLEYCEDIDVFTDVVRWGADQELEACYGWVGQFNYDDYSYGDRLRAARRSPKPPSLKEQALAALKRQSTRSVPSLVATEDCDTIRRALEQLDD